MSEEWDELCDDRLPECIGECDYCGGDIMEDDEWADLRNFLCGDCSALIERAQGDPILEDEL